MQILDMKAVKSFSYHHRYFFLSNQLAKTRRCTSFYSQHFHSTPSRFLSAKEQDSGDTSMGRNDSIPDRRVWSIYDPVKGRLVMQRSAKEKDEREIESPGFLSFYDEVEDQERKRIYGSARMENRRDKTQMGMSSSNKEIDGLSKARSYGGAKKENLSDLDVGNEKGIKGYGHTGVKKENSGDGSNSCMGLSRHSNKNEDSGNEMRYDKVKKISTGNELVEVADVVRHRKKGKSRTSWVCESCGHSSGQWWGSCRACNAVGTMKRFSEVSEVSGSKVSGIEVSENVVRSWLPHQSGGLSRLTDVQRGMDQLTWRIPLSGPFGSEVARVLGGGIVPGSLVLIGGDPGVGKSTLLLQIAAIIAEDQELGKPAPVVYVSGEESIEQIGNRADRLKIGTEELFLYSSTDIEDIFVNIQPLFPSVLIIDSIQTVYLKGVAGSAGGIQQVHECTSALLRFAKKTNIAVLLIGHVNKAGDIAGPRVLEHIVDVVLYMEGEKHSSHRLLRPVKNRFGSTDELGVFEMSQSGLQAVLSPSEIFLSENHSDSEVLAGIAVAVIMDGSRIFLIEVQALCTSASSFSRHYNGIQPSRADMIISVLMKQAGLMLKENTIFLNVVSGMALTETAGDVAIAAAICSSFLEFPIPNNIAFIGEIGLGGELRMVPRMDKRVNTVAKLGYKICIVPAAAEKSLANLGCEGMKIVGCKNMKEVLNIVFRSQ